MKQKPGEKNGLDVVKTEVKKILKEISEILEETRRRVPCRRLGELRAQAEKLERKL